MQVEVWAELDTYTDAMEGYPLGGGVDGARGFPLSAYCCISLWPLSTSQRCLLLMGYSLWLRLLLPDIQVK
jgi:hypothetical protein